MSYAEPKTSIERDESSRFQYTPLCYKEIRLLRLLPGDSQSDLKCQIDHLSPDHCPNMKLFLTPFETH